MAELKDLQSLVVKVRSERGFTTDPVRIYALHFDPSRLADELADSMVLLCALASEFDVDLETAVRSKFIAADSRRHWASAKQ